MEFKLAPVQSVESDASFNNTVQGALKQMAPDSVVDDSDEFHTHWVPPPKVNPEDSAIPSLQKREDEVFTGSESYVPPTLTVEPPETDTARGINEQVFGSGMDKPRGTTERQSPTSDASKSYEVTKYTLLWIGIAALAIYLVM